MAMVGLEQVRPLAVAASLTDSFHDFPGLDGEGFWTSAMDCAGYAKWLAQRVGINGHVGWLTGMMLRLGGLLIAQAKPEVLEAIGRGPAFRACAGSASKACWALPEARSQRT